MLTAQVLKNPLFAGVNPKVLAKALKKGAFLREYAPGETVVAAQEKTRALGVLLRGSAQVVKVVKGGHAIRMSELVPGNLLGAAMLFSDVSGAPTAISTRKGCAVQFFPEDTFAEMLRADFTLTRNYIAYLTQRIHFLTDRIESIGSPSATDKLLNHLAQCCLPQTGEVRLPRGMDALADTLCISRATMYRALKELEQAGFIRRDGRSIYLTNPAGGEAGI
ncbi:MAG: Crp/Fnr family transcriptional regulator [Christensenellaceae bacterium]|jgi:CRP-like cAMP-binding protein|nr:Crp/Fnr family transcriptional regulator [Christensenellaceae bacterium]